MISAWWLVVAWLMGIWMGDDTDKIKDLAIRNAELETEVRLLRERLGLPDNNDD